MISPWRLVADRTVAAKGGEHSLVSRVLAPRLEVFWRTAKFLAELDQRVAQAMRVEVRQPRRRECLAEDSADRRRVPPVLRL